LILLEINGKIIEKIGVRGWITLQAKIFRCFNNSVLKELLPKTVDCKTGGEGM